MAVLAAFVAERIELSRMDEGRRKTAEVRQPQGGDLGVGKLRAVGKIIFEIAIFVRFSSGCRICNG